MGIRHKLLDNFIATLSPLHTNLLMILIQCLMGYDTSGLCNIRDNLSSTILRLLKNEVNCVLSKLKLSRKVSLI